MSTTPDPDRTSPNTPPPIRSQRAFPWFWFGALIGTLLSAAGLGFAAWAWIFIHEELSPVISKALSESLERPVSLGDVEQVTLRSIEVGPSAIGASESDPTTVSAERVIVKFDLLDALFTSRLGLDLTVAEATGYLAQDEEKGWLNITIPKQPEDRQSRFKVRVDNVTVRDSQLTLVPLAEQTPAIPLDEVAGQLHFDEITVAGHDTRRTRFEIKGEPEAGGEIVLKGEVEPVTGQTPTSPAQEVPLRYATNLAVRGDQAPLADVLGFTLSSIGLPTDDVTVRSGRVSGALEMAFRPQQPVDYKGVLSVASGDLLTRILPLPVRNIEGQTRFKGNRWSVESLSADYGDIQNIEAQGLIDFDKGYDLSAVAEAVTVEDFTQTLNLALPVPTAGRFEVTAQMGGPLRNPEFSGTATATRALEVDRLTFSDAKADFFFRGQQLLIDNIAAVPTTGGSLRGSGLVRLGQGTPFTFQLAGRDLEAQAIAGLYDISPNFELGRVDADALLVSEGGAVTTDVRWRAPEAQYPGTGLVTIQGNQLAFRETTFDIGGGQVSGSGNLANGLWDSDVTIENVRLDVFSPELRGTASGQFQFRGSTADTRIGAIAATGDITFSDGVAAFNRQFDSFDQPLTAQVAWRGEKIEIIQATSDRITASGTLTPTFDRGFTGLERFDLNLSARDYDLANLPFALPEALALAGRGDFSGSLSGRPETPSLRGDLQLADLIVNRLPFDPQLSGTLAYSPSAGLDLQVAGGRDRIALTYAPDAASSQAPSSRPLSDQIAPAFGDLNFDIAWRDAFARGRSEGNLLNLEAGNFPLSALNFPPDGAGEIGQLRGILTRADLAVNLANQTLAGDIAIDQLGLGYIGAGRLEGTVRYADRLATLTGGQLFLNGNLYSLNGRLALEGMTPVYSASIQTQQGDIQNILTALSIYTLSDFRRGLSPPDWLTNPLSQADLNQVLATSPTGNSEAALLAQLRRLSEIQSLQADSAIAQESRPLPPLRELSGPFAGNIELNGSGTDFQLDFDLAGANWQWGEDYSAQEVIAKGTLTPNTLTFEPVRFSSLISDRSQESPAEEMDAVESDSDLPSLAEEAGFSAIEPVSPVDPTQRPAVASINLAGQLVFGRDTKLTSNLQATAENLEVAALRDILQLPLDIEGLANARATLGGTLANPQLRGLAELAAVTINDTPIESANAQFLYQNARLSLYSALTATAPEHPLTLSAQIPYAFNFMDVKPSTDDIAVEIDVQDEGLALLNIFNRQVAWESGQGQVNLKVGGTLTSPEIQGFATLDEAVINAQILPEPLTNVTGRASFVGDRIIIDTLQGRFSDGQLMAAGTFPLLYPILTGTQLSTLTANPPIPETTAEATHEGTEANPLFPQPLAANRPLTVNFQNIDLTLDKLYSGGVNGQIVVGGSALLGGPEIGGEVVLSDGQVLLSNGNGQTGDALEAGATDVGTSLEPAAGSLSSASGIEPNFRDLQLTLGESIRIVQGNLLNFVADGTLLLNGPPRALEPEGVINLRSGRVNLFTTLFRLRGRNNTAAFTPEMGLQNPFLDVSLRASVPEVSGTIPLANTPYASAEVADTSNDGFENPGSLRTIRVRADVNGPANAIFDNLELSSSPPRSEAELIGLIGGGFVTALESTVGSLSGNGDSFEGLINLVSGTILTSVQDLVGNTLSLSEFRLFPVTAASRSRPGEDRESGLDIGAEIGFDVSNATSLSISKILTDSTNPEFSANYRLTDSLTVRGTTNLDDINQVLLEYELRF